MISRDSVVLRTSRKQILIGLLVCLVFVVAGLAVVLLQGPDAGGWWWVGLGVLTSTGPLAYLVRPSKLLLDAEGLRWTSVFSTRHFAWADIAEVGVFAEGDDSPVVGIRLKTPPPSFGASMTSLLSGCDYKLPSTYGMSPENLAALLDDWRQAAQADDPAQI